MSTVEKFVAEAVRGRARVVSRDQTKPRLLLPTHLHLADHGKGEQQLLWQLGDGGAVPGAVARAFCQQAVQNVQQQEREVARLQRELEKLLEQHRDLVMAPAVPALVKLEVRVPLPHLGTVFVDELLWDLTAPRAACEGYVSEVTNDLRLDWQSHAVILRHLKDALSAALQGFAAGTTQLVPVPSSAQLLCSPPSALPRLVSSSNECLGESPAVPEHMEKPAAAKQADAGITKAADRPRAAETGMQTQAITASVQRQHSSDDSDMPDLPDE